MSSRRRRCDLAFGIATLVVMAVVSTFLIALPTLDGHDGGLSFIVNFALPDLPLAPSSRHIYPHEMNTAAGAVPNDAAKTEELRITSSSAKQNERNLTFGSDTFAIPPKVDPCKGRLFIVHWTHVPKAGGTAFARIAKRVACRMNADLFSDEVTNPCCERQQLCLKDNRCDTTVFGGCALVLGVGMHNFNGARLFDIGCEGCGQRWFELATERGLLTALLSKRPRGDFTIVGTGRRVNSTLEAASYRRWPIEQRVLFFARLGVSTDHIMSALRKQDAVAAAEIPRLAARADEVRCAKRPMLRETHDYRNNWVDFFRRCDGSHSMTILRHPFTRATSAYFYRGHSPNYDIFGLRPGLWYSPSVKITGTTLHEYFFLPEYRNLLTKMFGLSTACQDAKVRGCKPRSEERPQVPRKVFTCTSFTSAIQAVAYRPLLGW